jgi:hypothetical protein
MIEWKMKRKLSSRNEPAFSPIVTEVVSPNFVRLMLTISEMVALVRYDIKKFSRGLVLTMNIYKEIEGCLDNCLDLSTVVG